MLSIQLSFRRTSKEISRTRYLVKSNRSYQNILNWLWNDSWTNPLLMMAELDLLFLNKTYYESQLREVKMKKPLCSNYLSPTNYFCSALYSESLFSLVSSFYFSGCLWILTLLRWLRIKSRCCSNSESNSYHTVCIDNGDDYCSEDCSSGPSFINSYLICPI